MLRVLVPILFLSLLAGCGSSAPSEEQGGGAVLDRPHTAAMAIPGWLQFSDLSLHADWEGATPRGPFLRGMILGNTFQPAGRVIGLVEVETGGRILDRGWLDLRTLAFYRENAAVGHRMPWIEGRRDAETGSFLPATDVFNGSSDE